MTLHDLQFDSQGGNHLDLMDKLFSLALSAENRTLSSIHERMYRKLMTGIREEITQKVDVLTTRTIAYPHSRQALEMVLGRLRTFANQHGPHQMHQPRKFKTLLYNLELVDKLERIDWDNHTMDAFSPVDELLIYMNYNSKRYIRMLEEWLADHINKDQDLVEQLKIIQYYAKAFAQLQRKPDTALHYDYLPIHEVLTNWFTHETEYLENQLSLKERVKESTESKIPTVVKPEQKIEWQLSGDQIALLLRSAYDSGLIDAKSLNALYHVVVPHVKTPYSVSLSPSATRSAAYQAEQTDKDVTTGYLAKMQRFINDY